MSGTQLRAQLRGRIHDALANGFAVLGGQRLVLSAERDGVCEGLQSLTQLVAGVHVEQLAALEVLPTGAPIPVGYKSVAFSLTLRADDQTLTDDHAEETMQSVLKALKETFNATIR